MFEDSANNDASYKKKKALLYAGIITFIIAILYIFLIRNNIYQFGGVKKDVKPAAEFIKEVFHKVNTDIETGNKIIDNKKKN